MWQDCLKSFGGGKPAASSTGSEWRSVSGNGNGVLSASQRLLQDLCLVACFLRRPKCFILWARFSGRGSCYKKTGTVRKIINSSVPETLATYLHFRSGLFWEANSLGQAHFSLHSLPFSHLRLSSAGSKEPLSPAGAPSQLYFEMSVAGQFSLIWLFRGCVWGLT